MRELKLQIPHWAMANISLFGCAGGGGGTVDGGCGATTGGGGGGGVCASLAARCIFPVVGVVGVVFGLIDAVGKFFGVISLRFAAAPNDLNVKFQFLRYFH